MGFSSSANFKATSKPSFNLILSLNRILAFKVVPFVSVYVGELCPIVQIIEDKAHPSIKCLT